MIKILNQSMQLVAILQDAFGVGYRKVRNSLWTASFSLPASDEKNEECTAFRFVEIHDEGEYIGLFRILPNNTIRSRDGATITYQCEHVLATLLDDVLFQYHTVGNLGYFTPNVIQYVLSKQTVGRWQLGTCEFNRQFEYNWENDNLLGALFSIPKPFIDEYQWTWNTQTYPWTLNLVKPSTTVGAHIVYGHNMQSIERHEDPTNLCTRIYPLGYGEGVNQLNISDVNGGLPYIDADTQGQYGIISKVWVDRRYEDATTLKAMAQSMLEQLKQPFRSYRVKGVDNYVITGDVADRVQLGMLVRVRDEELGIDFIDRIVVLEKGDMYGNKGDTNTEIANKSKDVAGSLADLESRQRINETHAQGATNVNVYNLAENCDPTHPAKFKIWIPDEAVRINKVLLTYENEPFRANSKAIASAPATTSGSSSTTTTSSGGGSYPSTDTNYWTLYPPTFLPGDFMNGAGEDYHAHSMYSVSHVHTVNIPVHAHNMEHYHIIPSHTHDIQFGIYEGMTATSNGILVDGNLVPGSATSATNLDLTSYLAVDGGGKIQRGQFHEIEIIPNTLSRIVATIVIQFFVQSRGGGSY